jgi:hypothetical protein
MTREISATLLTAVTGRITRPAYLIELAFSSFLRYSTGNLSSFNGNVWIPVKADIALGMAGDRAAITIWDHDATLRTLLLTEGVTDRAVKIWQYDDNAVAETDPTLVFSGAATGSRRARGFVNIDLAVANSKGLLCPRERICAATGFSVLIEAGTLIPWGSKILKVERRDA